MDANVDQLFLMYYLRSPAGQAQIASKTVGTSQPKLALFRIQEVEIPLPPISTQREIASVLSAYDDLIENNTRRIAILEEMAQRLYREWFVDFRIPGHEVVRTVESELGPIPEGWEVKKLGQVCTYINRGISPKYDEHAIDVVINQKCIRDGRITLGPARRHSSRVPADKLVRFGDVLVNSTGIGTLGRVAQVYDDIENTTVDSHVSIVRPGEVVSVDYLGLALLAMQAHFESMGQGATGQTELSRQSIAETRLAVPTRDIQESFASAAAPVRKLAVVLASKNSNLSRTRDLLLPKLMSGEVDVERMSIDTEGSVA